MYLISKAILLIKNQIELNIGKIQINKQSEISLNKKWKNG